MQLQRSKFNTIPLQGCQDAVEVALCGCTTTPQLGAIDKQFVRATHLEETLLPFSLSALCVFIGCFTTMQRRGNPFYVLALVTSVTVSTIVAAPIFAAAIIDPSSPTLGLRIYTAASPVPLANLTALAFGSFDDQITTTGWSFLSLSTNASTAYTDAQTATAAGLLEGWLTAARSVEFIHNLHNDSTTFSPALLSYVMANLAYVRSEAARLGDSDPFWHQVGLLYAYIDAMWVGFNSSVSDGQQLDFLTYYSATLVGDLDDLCPAFGCTKPRLPSGRHFSDGHCSVLVKAIPATTGGGFADLYATHTTWDPLECMTRVWKTYTYPWAVTAAPSAQAARGAAVGAPSTAAAGAAGCSQRFTALSGSLGGPAEPCDGASASRLPTYETATIQAAVDAGAVVPGVTMTFSSFPASTARDTVQALSHRNPPPLRRPLHGDTTPIRYLLQAVAYSFDDWYQLSPSRLVVTETTIINANASLWAAVTPSAVSDWARNMAANRLAASGDDWMRTFSRYNSGTYNNMFSVVDYKVRGACAAIVDLLSNARDSSCYGASGQLVWPPPLPSLTQWLLPSLPRTCQSPPSSLARF